MLKWKNNLYIGKNVKNSRKIQLKIDSGKLVPGIYLVTISDNPGNLLEIIPAPMLLQKSAYALCPEIVGLAKGKDEAMDLAAEIILEVYHETGSFRVEEYLKNR
ncbi:MAG: hypothetical protein Q4D16_06550 [Eubacteriales bacterium]|nr:hypothetical protein [Eubacteriales bacterium]